MDSNISSFWQSKHFQSTVDGLLLPVSHTDLVTNLYVDIDYDVDHIRASCIGPIAVVQQSETLSDIV